MSDKPIIKISIDADEFDAFREKFQSYQDSLKLQPAQWAASNAGVQHIKTSFEEAADAFNKLSKTAVNPAFAGSSGVFTKFEKSSAATAKSWALTSKSIGVASRELSGLAKMAIGLRSFGSNLLGGIAGIGFSAFGAAVAATNSIANENINNRKLGLPSGEEKSFDVNYEKMGGDSGLLGNMANAKVDRSKWGALIAAGITTQEIQSKDPADLAAEFIEKAGAKFNSLATNGASWSNKTGVSAFLDTSKLRLAGSYSSDDYAKTHEQYRADIPKFAIDQKTKDDATNARRQYETAWEQITTAIGKPLIPLAGQFGTLSGKVADAISAFAGTGELKKDIDSAASSFVTIGKAGDWLAATLNNITGKQPDTGVTVDPGSIAADVVKYWGEAKANLKGNFFGHFGSGGKAPVFHLDSDHPAGTVGKGAPSPGSHWDWPWETTPAKPSSGAVSESQFIRDPAKPALMAELERRYEMPKGLLGVQEQKESSGGTNNINPKNPNVLGAFQFDEPTAKRYGVNRFDERSSTVGAARMLNDLHTRYGAWDKALAKFDGFAGLDADIAKYGDAWKDHISEFQKGSTETTDYLAFIKNHGVDIDAKQPSLKAQMSSLDADQKRRASKASDGASTGASTGAGASNQYNRPVYVSNAPTQFAFTMNTPAGTDVSTIAGGLAQ